MGEYAEEAILSDMDEDYEDWLEQEVEPVATAWEVAQYQLATLFYDFNVEKEIRDQVVAIMEIYGDNLLKELL